MSAVYVLLVLILVLAVIWARHASAEGFLPRQHYAPVCNEPNCRKTAAERQFCRGLTTGAMPVIDESPSLCRPFCCGVSSVPP